MPLVGPAVVAPVDVLKASSWESVRRISDKYLPRWIRTLLDNFEKARAGTSIRAVIRLLEGEEFDKVVDEIDWIHIDGPHVEGMRAALPLLIRDVMESTAAEAASALGRRQGIAVVGAFDVVNPRVVEWIRENAGARITEISATSREAIRLLIERGIREGIPPASLARMIRSSIGLHSRQVRAVANLRARMLADGRPAAMIEKAVERYTARLLKQRAEMIARTEIIKAETQGQLELWRQQAEAGNIDRNLAGVRWIVTPDDRLCPECSELDEVVVGLGELFPGGVEGSPLHPSCRCVVALVPEWRKLRLVA